MFDLRIKSYDIDPRYFLDGMPIKIAAPYY